MRYGNPWEVVRPELAYEVKLGGCTESWTDEQSRYRVRWKPEHVVQGVAYDTPVLGYHVNTCNRMRLWKAETVESFDFSAFNHGEAGKSSLLNLNQQQRRPIRRRKFIEGCACLKRG